MAAHLAGMYRVEDLVPLIERKDYTAAHGLTGALEVIQAIRDIADEMEADSRKSVAELEM